MQAVKLAWQMRYAAISCHALKAGPAHDRAAGERLPTIYQQERPLSSVPWLALSLETITITIILFTSFQWGTGEKSREKHLDGLPVP